jgi:hypothetical protein
MKTILSLNSRTKIPIINPMNKDSIFFENPKELPNTPNTSKTHSLCLSFKPQYAVTLQRRTLPFMIMIAKAFK